MEHIVNLQVFRMVLCGVPRSGKTTFWKRLAIKDFKPSKSSPSTAAAESCIISAHERKTHAKHKAHIHTEMLFDLHLYSEDKDLDHDHDREALSIYKLILEKHKKTPKTEDKPQKPQSKLQASKTKEQVEETHSVYIERDNPKATKHFHSAAIHLESDDTQTPYLTQDQIQAALLA